MSANTNNAADKLAKTLLNTCHPDKHGAEFQAEANELTKRINAAREKGDIATLKQIDADLKAGKYFKVKVDYTAEAEALKAQGKTKTQAKGFAAFNAWPKEGLDAIDAVYGSGRATADHAKAVACLIRGKANGRTNKEIVAELMEELNWTASTAQTLLAYYSYMQEYARQINA